MHSLDGFLDLPVIGPSGRLSTLNFGGGQAPPKPPKLKMPEMPKFEFPEYKPPVIPPAPPPPPNTVTTTDTTGAGEDARTAAYRKKGTARTLFAGAASGTKPLGSTSGGSSTLG